MVAEADRQGPTTNEKGKGRKYTSRSFYAAAVSEAEQYRLPEALEIEGLGQQIALLRVQLNRLASQDPDNTTLLFKDIELLVKAVAARYRISRKSTEDLSETIEVVLKGVGGALSLEEFSEN